MALTTSKTISLTRSCDFGCPNLAKYDAPTTGGAWAYMCQAHAERLMKPDWPVGYKLEPEGEEG